MVCVGTSAAKRPRLNINPSGDAAGAGLNRRAGGVGAHWPDAPEGMRQLGDAVGIAALGDAMGDAPEWRSGEDSDVDMREDAAATTVVSPRGERGLRVGAPVEELEVWEPCH